MLEKMFMKNISIGVIVFIISDESQNVSLNKVPQNSSGAPRQVFITHRDVLCFKLPSFFPEKNITVFFVF